MKIGDITEFGEVSFIDYDNCFCQFCDPGSKGIHGVFSMTFKEIEEKNITSHLEMDASRHGSIMYY